MAWLVLMSEVMCMSKSQYTSTTMFNAQAVEYSNTECRPVRFPCSDMPVMEQGIRVDADIAAVLVVLARKH